MRYITRPIISNILLVIESILLFLITSTFILKITIFNEKYAVKNIDETYYETVYNDTIDIMSYITRKSNLKEILIQNIFTIEDIKEDTKSFVKSLYSKEKLEIDTSLIEININKNIEDYEEKNKKIDNKVKNEFINKIVSTYKNEITLLNSFEENSVTLNKYNNLNNTLLLMFIVDLIILLIINKKIFKKDEYYIVLLSSSISLFLSSIYLKLSSIKNIFIYNNNVSRIVRKIITKPTNISIIFIIIYTIIGIYLLKKKKEK